MSYVSTVSLLAQGEHFEISNTRFRLAHSLETGTDPGTGPTSLGLPDTSVRVHH